MTGVQSREIAQTARLLREGALTSMQITREYLAGIARMNTELNAFITVMHDDALAAAAAADQRLQSGTQRSLLDGIPLALKDNIDCIGAPVTNGVGALRNRLAARDAEVTQRLRTAGAVILGKLNMDEAALGATTNNPHFGACSNPRVAGDTAGGSSGGSAAAVAANLCAAALGSDTLGSVRLPAAYCGVTGFLASRGQVSRRGLSHLSISLDQIGVLARSCGDAAAVYDVIVGHDPYDEQSWPCAGFEPVAPPSGGFKIATVDCAGFCDAPDVVAIASAVSRARAALTDAGHSLVETLAAPTDFTALRRSALLVIEAEGAVACSDWLYQDGVSESLRRFLDYGARQPAQRIEYARAQLREARLAWRQLLRRHDFLLLPTAPQCSFPLDAAAPANQADFTTPASVAGLPAISVACGRSVAGRCLSVQLIGRPAREADLLALGAQLETGIRID